MSELGFLVKVIERKEVHSDIFLFLRFQNGNTSWSHYDEEEDIQVGDIFFITNELMLKVEKEMWHEPHYKGEVYSIEDNKVEILFNNLKYEFRTDIEIEVGDIVYFNFESGVESIYRNSEIEKESLYVSNFRYDPENVKDNFQDYGGNRYVVERAKELIEISLTKKDTLQALGTIPIKGVLFTGPPGTGKTMLARIITREVEANLYHINGPEIFTKYYGDSEKLLREIFEDAQTRERAIIFFDEIDSIASRRQDNSHEASKRIVTQLLTLMDGFKQDNNVLVIGTTNRPDDIDPALRRPGRFDWEIKFSPPTTVEEVIHILMTSGRKISKSDEISYYEIASKLSGWSPSEIAGLWNEAGIIAIKDNRDKIYEEDLEGALYRMSERK